MPDVSLTSYPLLYKIQWCAEGATRSFFGLRKDLVLSNKLYLGNKNNLSTDGEVAIGYRTAPVGAGETI
jgi:hypothetical protein